MNRLCRAIKAIANAFLILCLSCLVVLQLDSPARAEELIDGPTFNNPLGSPEEQYAIINKLQSMIDAAPPKSYIRMSFYSLTIPSFVDRLVEAHKRGVNVRVIMSQHADGPQWGKLEKELGTNRKASSFALLCKGGCMTGQEGSYMHAKIFLFSSTGNSKNVAVVSSANPTNMQARVGFNDAYTIVGNLVMYKTYLNYFEDMADGAKGKRWSNYYRTALDGKYKTYLFPRAGDTSLTDTVYQVLSNVKCSGVASSYGKNGRTIIQVGVHGWTKGRLNLAKKLWSLDNAGCEVEVVYSGKIFDERTGKTVVEPEIKAALAKKGGRYGGPKVYDFTEDFDNDGKFDAYIHTKYILINGNYAGNPKSKYVFTGSHNFTKNGLRYNNEAILRIKDDRVHKVYACHFMAMKDIAYKKLDAHTVDQCRLYVP